MGAHIRVHWSVIFGALALNGFEWNPPGYLIFVLSVLVHEAGHAYLVVHRKLRPEAINIHGLGGECWYSSRGNPMDEAVIAWGGVLAQLYVIVIPCYIIRFTYGDSHILYQTLRMNLFLIAFNLLPVPPLDGATAWKFFKLIRKKKRKQVRKIVAKASTLRTEKDVEAEAKQLVENALKRAKDSKN